MLKSRVTLRNTFRDLLNLTKRYLQCSKTPPPSQCSRSQQSYFFFRSSIRAASHHNFCYLPYWFGWCRDMYIQLGRIF